MPGGMVKVEGLDCLLSSIRRRVKHVKEGRSIDFDEQRDCNYQIGVRV